ncbi:MAG: PadR family transcriptional regulator [Desulfurococcaceae archaeon]
MRKCMKKWNGVRRYLVLKVLDLISKEPIHGYGILKSLEDDLGIRLSPGLLYPILKTLVEREFAIAREELFNGKRMVIYEITSLGLKYLEEHRSLLMEFDKKASRIKHSRLHELLLKIRHLYMNIDKLDNQDLERLKNAVEKFLDEVKSIGV